MLPGRCAHAALHDGAPGPTATITADIFVLAAGAVENTRILLLSGLGDQAGHCGRHLCDHPYLWTAAQLDLGASTSDAHPFFFSDRPLRIGPGVGAIGAVVPRPEASGGAGFRALLGGADGLPGTISLCWEQEATPGSRITLSDQLPPDPLGLPRVKVDADVADGDRRTPVEAITTLVRALEEAGLARARALPPLDHDPWSWRQPGRIVPGNHPMGTTRMSSRAEDGVVDPNARVHDTSNLYVLGSSVFPRGGYANPMLTVLALSARLADHIQAASTP